MKAYHLTESAMPQTVAIIFGRFNPPHKGHKHAWETASQVADDWYVGTNKSTIGPDDPLPFEVKIEAMKAIMPEVENHLVAEQSWWTLATYVFKKYGGVPGRTLPITLLVITDEPYVVPGLLKSNGQVSNHGEYSFQDIKLPFENIEQAKKHLRISSATALRNAVAAGDREGFAQAAGVDADTPVAGHKFFDLVAHYLMPHREAHAAKERAKAEKAAAKQAAEQAKAQKAAEKAKAKGPAQELAESGICWKGYKRKPGTKKYAPGSCEKIEEKSVSQKQARFMAAAAHDPQFAARAGIKQSVAKEFNKADTGTKRLSQAMKNKPKKKLSEIAGAFPSPSTRAKWAAGAAANPKTIQETPYKRISQALDELYENRNGSIQQDVADSLPQTYVIPKLQNQDAYNQYRFGLAIAAARGQSARQSEHGEQFAGMSPWGENEIVVTFDPSETETIDSALKLVGLSTSDKRSLNTKNSMETPDVVKRSPVANIKRNKYGI